jgi:hypothetical protein
MTIFFTSLSTDRKLDKQYLINLWLYHEHGEDTTKTFTSVIIHYAECYYVECHYAEYHYAECRHAECH